MTRSIFKVLAPAAALIGAVSMAAPAMATDTSFATYTGTAGGFVVTQTGAAVTMSETGTVVFSFLNTKLASVVTGEPASLTFTAAAPNTSYSGGKAPDQGDVTGTYKFTSKVAYKVNGKTYAAGSNLLTVVFDGGDILGKAGAPSAALSADSGTGTVTYTSDFLSFTNSSFRDFTDALGALKPKYPSKTATQLPSFVGTPTGSFSSDPAPIVLAFAPEPATWAMMLIGFGAIGMGLRGTRRQTLTA